MMQLQRVVSLLFLVVAFGLTFAIHLAAASPHRNTAGDPSTIIPFGTAIAQAKFTMEEMTLFTYTVKGDNGAAITHWWFTGVPDVRNLVLRFFIDGETTPSIETETYLGAGIGFDDEAAPWGTELVGKGAVNGGVYNNMRIPFRKSIRVTGQQATGKPTGLFWFIIRGAEGMSIYLGDVLLPQTARLKLFKMERVAYTPYEFVYPLNVTGSAGGLLMWTLVVTSGDLNFLEGCVRCYIDDGPRILLSSGTEDYFDSAYYFNAGPFHLSVSGLTHLQTNKGPMNTTFSAYRFHTMDPIIWQRSLKWVWRNGETVDSSGQKCTLQAEIQRQAGDTDDGLHFHNTRLTGSVVSSYAWVYLW